MSRMEKAARAASLAAQSVPRHQIANELGVTARYVHELLSDPTGAKALRRQHKHRHGIEALTHACAPAGSCRSCGCTLSTYRGLVDPMRPRLGYEVYCAPCAPIHAGYRVTCAVAEVV